MFKQLLNLRPYSWIDLIFLGFLAKFSLFSQFVFSIKDAWLVISLLSLWFFFNLVLEKKHDYNYRAKPRLIFMILSLLIPIGISLFVCPWSLIPLGTLTIFVFLYLLKRKNKTMGSLSGFFRGLIQSCYFVYAGLFYTNNLTPSFIVISIIIFLITFARSLIGDLRDEKSNMEYNKKTFVVNYGKVISVIVIETFLTIALVLSYSYFNILTTITLILLAIALLFYKNYYFLHQLTIITTMFFSVNLISFFVDFNLLFMNLIYLGVFLNLIFYPLLNRASNPKFEQDKEYNL